MSRAVCFTAGPSGTHMKLGERTASTVPSTGLRGDKKPAAVSAFCCAGTVGNRSTTQVSAARLLRPQSMSRLVPSVARRTAT